MIESFYRLTILIGRLTKGFISESLELLLIISYVITIILGQTQST